MKNKGTTPDLEKATSSASGACGHFVKIHAILRTFWVQNPAFLTEEVLKMENWGLIKENWGCMMENWGLRIQKWGWRVVDWGYTNKIWGVDHATPIFNRNNFVLPLSRITLFWGHLKTPNFPLEDILQLFPGLLQSCGENFLNTLKLVSSWSVV